jgi:hypothetical protein
MKLSRTNLCDYCNMQSESLKHLFWECHYVQVMWNQLGKVLNLNDLPIIFIFKTTVLRLM